MPMLRDGLVGGHKDAPLRRGFSGFVKDRNDGRNGATERAPRDVIFEAVGIAGAGRELGARAHPLKEAAGVSPVESRAHHVGALQAVGPFLERVLHVLAVSLARSSHR